MNFAGCSVFGKKLNGRKAKMENVQQKVQDAVNDMISKLDKEHFRKMQVDGYLTLTFTQYRPSTHG